MSEIIARVRGIRVFTVDGVTSVQLTLDKEIEGYALGENGVFVKRMTNKVTFFRSVLTSQLCDVNDDIALYRVCQGRALSQEEFAKILFNSKLTLDIVEHKQGEVVEINGTERTIERDCIFVNAVNVKLSAEAQARLEKSFEL